VGAAALLHLAWWDRLAAAVAHQWSRTGYARSGDDDAFINQAGLSDWVAAAPEYAMREVLRAAEGADLAAAAVSEVLRTEIVAGGEGWVCERSIHRTEHIEQVERVLGRA